MKIQLILSSLISSTLVLSALPYVGVQEGVVSQNFKPKIKSRDIDFNNNNQAFDASQRFNMHSNALAFGVLAGWRFSSVAGKVSPFIEGDYSYVNKQKTRSSVDMDISDKANQLDNEGVSIKIKQNFGCMVGAEVLVMQDFSALVGVRLNLTHYSVSGFHKFKDGACDEQAKKVYLLGVEPTLGVKYNFTKNIAARFTAGYNISQSRTVVQNYISDPLCVGDGVSSSVRIRPRGFNLRAAVIVGF